MKKKFTLVLSTLMAVGLVYDYNYRMVHSSSDGAPAGRTGSPGDGITCNTGCHGGQPGNPQGNEMSTITGNIPPTGYVPGTTYDMTVSMQGGSSSYGFSLTVEDDANVNQGTLIAPNGSNTQINGSGDYITQTTNLGQGSQSWNFQWTAPSAGVGEVTFYAATMYGSGGAGNNNDVMVLTNASFQEASNVSITEAELKSLVVYPNPVIDEIHVASKDIDEEMMITMFDVSGRQVLQENHESGDVKIDVSSKNLNTGVYFLKVEAGGNSTIKKLLVK